MDFLRDLDLLKRVCVPKRHKLDKMVPLQKRVICVCGEVCVVEEGVTDGATVMCADRCLYFIQELCYLMLMRMLVFRGKL